MPDGAMLVVLLTNQKDYGPLALADRAGVVLVKRRVSLSKKHLTFAMLSCYNVVLGVYRGRPR